MLNKIRYLINALSESLLFYLRKGIHFKKTNLFLYTTFTRILGYTELMLKYFM